MTKKGLTQITIVLDRSGSMGDVRDATISGFNEFVDGQKATPGDANLTLIQFDTENPYELVFDKPLKDTPKLTTETFVPRAGTPLHDALGRAITELGAKLAKLQDNERPDKVVIVTMTDGLENSSREYTAPQLADLIKHQRDTYNWQFLFLGANQDAVLTGEKLNIPKHSSISYAATAGGTRSAMRSTSASVSSYRTGLTESALYSEDQRKEALEEEPPKAKRQGK